MNKYFARRSGSRFLVRREILLAVVGTISAGVCCFGSFANILTAEEAQNFAFDKPLYVANRAPLLPSALVKLPIGSITPKGWLKHQLELEAKGMTGRLPEISKWCKFENSAWANPNGQGENAWEELPYWLKGYGDLGYVLKDQDIIQQARKWIDAVLASQEPDGYFGPRANKTGLKGKPDLWPHMVMCNVLQTFYEYSGDARVVPFLTRYLRWLNTLPAEDFGAGYWPRIRAGDTIETCYWVYNRTGESWLLELAKRIHENMQDWTSGIHDWHNVNVAQAFREPGVYFQQARDDKFLQAAENNYQTVMGSYGQFPGGGFGGDEVCRPGYTDPRQGFETCGMVEFMHSFEMLTKISANPIWADRCEEVAFNSLPAALTPDWKALHYLTGANQIQLDRKNKAPEIMNDGTMFSYSPFEVYRCCQHNVSHGWPYYAEELWLGTADHGLYASLYAASEVTAAVGDGTTIKVSEETDYPFEETVRLKISTPKKVSFPLHLRIPGWCDRPQVELNGRAIAAPIDGHSNVVLTRLWASGDSITLRFPMKVTIRKWEKNQNAVSVNYGPLSFSLKIGEKWSRYGGTDSWPEYEVFPTTAWNYGLLLDEKNPAKSFQVIRKRGKLADQPFTAESSPIELRVKAKKIAAWKQDALGMVGKLQASPAKSGEPPENVTLIPMGAARLRISSIPTIGGGSDAHEWTSPKTPPVSASHCFEGDSVEAMIDGREPKNSHDHDIPRFTWWDHRGGTEWVEHHFEPARKISSVEIYWFDDSGSGQCRVPKSWRLLYRNGGDWKPVESHSAFGTKLDEYNKTEFKAVETTALRVEVNLQPEFSGGILEWKTH